MANTITRRHLESIEGADLGSLGTSGGNLQINISDPLIQEIESRYTEACQRDDFIVFTAKHFNGAGMNAESLDLGNARDFLVNAGRSTNGGQNLFEMMGVIAQHEEIHLGEAKPFEHLDICFLTRLIDE